MRLSEERINSIAEKIALKLRRKGMVTAKGSLTTLASWIEKPMIAHMALEDDIDEIIRHQIMNLKNAPPEGSYDYQALFRKKKDEMARRKGFEK